MICGGTGGQPMKWNTLITAILTRADDDTLTAEVLVILFFFPLTTALTHSVSLSFSLSLSLSLSLSVINTYLCKKAGDEDDIKMERACNSHLKGFPIDFQDPCVTIRQDQTEISRKVAYNLMKKNNSIKKLICNTRPLLDHLWMNWRPQTPGPSADYPRP